MRSTSPTTTPEPPARRYALIAAAGVATLLLFGAALWGAFGSARITGGGCSFNGPSDLSHSYMIGMDSFQYDVDCPSADIGWTAQAQIQEATAAGGWNTVSTIKRVGPGSSADRTAHLLTSCRHGQRYRGRLDLGSASAVATFPPEGTPLC